MKIGISIGNSRKEIYWKYEEMELEEFKKRISSTIRTDETMAEYAALPKAQADDIKDVGGFVLGRLKYNRRRKDCVINRSALSLDMDYATADIIEEMKKSFAFKCYFYSTHKHTKEKPRLRLIIPLSRTVSPDEYSAVCRKVAQEINIEMFDDTTYEPSRLMYWPSTSKDGEFIFEEIGEDLLNPDNFLGKYKDWTNSKEWPISTRQKTIIETNVKKQADPLDKKGIIGEFCRAYNICDALDTFLSHVYEKSEISGRYNYIPATSQGGLVIYDDKFAYSHHATDPACGKLMNSFDIVRIHKFSHLDDKATDKENSCKSSFKAMQKFALSDEKVKLQLAKERQIVAQSEFNVVDTDEDDDENWQATLELDKNGVVKSSLSNMANIIRNDKNLKNIVYNDLKSSLDVKGELPWKQAKPGWNDADLSCIKLYCERVYKIWSPSKFKDALLGVVSSERIYHPIKEYFSTLTWDKTPRIDTLLIDYLGADDNPYVRAVTRKTLCAAVARIYEPGIKFDSILVLNGPQGIGKSTLFSVLGKKWYSDSLIISDMKDKSSAEKLQGYWILELGELAGIRKMDVETVKSFITRTDDKFRQSYGVNVESHPRSNIIVGTTNSEDGFLRDVTGNRRFWPVYVTGKGKHKPWDLKDVDQIWAEAIVRYKEKEELFLKGDTLIHANMAQKQAMEHDEREGIILEYLEKSLPEDWNSKNLYERRNFIHGYEDFESSKIKGSIKREKVCIMEIWCECFGNNRQDLKRGNSYEIEGILNRIGGWEKLSSNKSGKTRYPLYGPQRTFVRKFS
ncbi:VapE domain-containing protein [Terrisporobacter vanillatitrophus]|uniref:VapE domain-containing protein n=1 Tax=Terrisporobacter vanillatitrophus TaxID=3058402 RepID=UPI003367F5DD